MTIVFFCCLMVGVVILSWPLGKMMTWAMIPGSSTGELRSRLDKVLRRIGGPLCADEQNWKAYSLSLLTFNGVMFTAAYLILSFQQILFLNPDGKGALEPSLVFNTISSFVTNTNLQHYAGETVMSYSSQIFALMWLQFVSAATGIAALAAISRGLSGNPLMGNFYRDLISAGFLVLLPLALLLAGLLVLGGVPMTLGGAVSVKTIEGAIQTIARGPVAAFVAIKQLGTNGGGFFGPNATHPFENPSFYTNAIEWISILLLPMAGLWMFGRITGRIRHATVVFAVMLILLVGKIGLSIYFESSSTVAFRDLPIVSGPNLEGKELRFGADAAPIWAATTTATSNGSVNCMHDSLNPLTGLIPLVGMWLNCIFGGVGVGFINMFLYIIVGVFICGMMVGRTPEYYGRKVETGEMKLALLALLLHPLLILGGTAVFASTSWGISTIHNPGPHGFTEMLYEFSSAAANNGSGFEGLGDNTVSWNVATGLVMLLARFIPIILPLAISGSLAGKKSSPETGGSLRTDTALFGIVILGSVLFIGALLFLPVAVLGPIAEHLATVSR
jgi:potassium-transporting ATPase potassium-binding subunit